MKATLPSPALRPPTTDERDDCCVPTGQPVPDPGASRALAGRLKALSDPTRLQLLQLVAAHPGGTACICDLTEPLGVTQPTVSHHMKLLAEAGLVTREQRGRWAHYTIQPDALAELGELVARIARSSPCSNSMADSRQAVTAS
ncbi:ArsR/SmtB family transcription factor [Pseudoclavibacter caeni]|jgi:ArsR family transcriptional regulator, arsenate/arsenite/antimonite-responsive transcriptional repressor|uniref:Helix-turn-helix transcriptional regulator n=1 Tax=Pseudoclavibacter caeni TaxID=908846 RepID=A0A7C8BP05_9MICO|nr:metalloregulator ArsR/SmtB family transcription factor [Pseudoclavibacter caeni]KAB1633383.1 helix-turn-helix transcriptional regulator [Pseudoclavibacter caeni]NYJ96637.1 ArsR family transcriptional regulator [Pseudoclavibacter caeni]